MINRQGWIYDLEFRRSRHMPIQSPRESISAFIRRANDIYESYQKKRALVIPVTPPKVN